MGVRSCGRALRLTAARPRPPPRLPAALVGVNVSTLSLFARDYRTIRGGGTRASVRLLGDEEKDRVMPMLPGPGWP